MKKPSKKEPSWLLPSIFIIWGGAMIASPDGKVTGAVFIGKDASTFGWILILFGVVFLLRELSGWLE